MKNLSKKLGITAIVALIGFNCFIAADICNNNKSLNYFFNIASASAENGVDAEGNGKYVYSELKGKPKECTLYVEFNGSGQAGFSSEDNFEASAGYTVRKIKGVKELCPKSGSGCTVYSCRQTDN
ncbi:hypothetical protein EMN47_14050 [Prolixibacteraceae bacterium JC049]|nr:hypothetical protein [Prolixibacteraceae bacterium JC049]